jgi:hypothetical protein
MHNYLEYKLKETSQMGFMNEINKTRDLYKELMEAIQIALECSKAMKLGK